MVHRVGAGREPQNFPPTAGAEAAASVRAFAMPAKRALKLDKPIMEKGPVTPLVNSKKNLQSYSPTTGTCLMSPFSSPKSNNVQEHRNGLSNGWHV